jgi:uncharacterized cupredoxin-like copper-binding protein
MTMKRHGTRWKVAAGAAALALLVTACGDDDEDEDASTDTTAAPAAEDGGGDDADAADFEVAPEDEEYCTIAAELDEQEDFPSAEQLDEIQAAAPEEISDEIDTVVEAFRANSEDPFVVFDDPVVGEAFGPIEDFEAEHCGLHSEDEDEPDQDPSVTEPDESAAQVAVSATEYAFALDSDPAAGRTQFTMTNDGQQRHILVLFKLAEGATMEQVEESEGEEGIDGPELESETAAPGETAVLTTDLVPGDYAIICYLPDPDGTPHVALGMVKEFTVQ